jgi:hypothetical protein
MCISTEKSQPRGTFCSMTYHLLKSETGTGITWIGICTVEEYFTAHKRYDYATMQSTALCFSVIDKQTTSIHLSGIIAPHLSA